MKKKITTILALAVLFPKVASAHCPLCTVGAGALAVAAASLGVATPVVGAFIGAFALALGLWAVKAVKRKYFKHQDALLALVIYLSTVIPIMPLIREYRPLYISLFGEYGTLFHNTYSVNIYLLGAVVGAALLAAAPYISRFVTEKRGGKTVPYQGIGITFTILLLAGIVFQLTF